MNLQQFALGILIALPIAVMAQRPQGGQKPGSGQGERPKIGVVFGTVEDANSGNPIEFATISILAFDENKVITGGVTDPKGRFRITEIPLGRFRAQVGFMGYASIEVGDCLLYTSPSPRD